MGPLERLHWALRYPGGLEVLEPEEGWSIRNGTCDAEALLINFYDGSEVGRVVGVKLTAEFPVPVFYRRWSMGPFEGNDNRTLDAVVFGRVSRYVEEGRNEGTLWAFTREDPTQALPCPPQHVDTSAIKLIASAYGR